jgi:hypothetical protein
MNGAATNNLQATTVPTNGGAATIPAEGYLVQKKGRTYAGYFEYGFRVREQLYLIKGLI